VSPLSLRRHRAERLLRERFEELRGRVLASVRGRLRASGVTLDEADLDAVYSQAWQGLYMAILDGEEIANPAGWLVVVTHRRALDEHRSRSRGHGGDALASAERDLAAELDDRMRLRQLFEGLRGRLDEREREAATLCYLQGLSRADAAARMGIGEGRMRKLMEGRGPGRPGVAAKMGELISSIREDGWCKEQGSLMRALAYGVLDPEGERYQLALMHSSQCPSCRAYVVSLRGLAATLPPVLLPGGLCAAVLAHVVAGVHAAAGTTAGGGAAGAASSGTVGSAGGGAGGSAGGGLGAAVQAGRGLGGAVSTTGAAGAAGAGGAAAGGGWLFAGGPLTAKLAAGCLLALGVGAGCLALEGDLRLPAPHRHHSHPAAVVRTDVATELNASQLTQGAAGVATTTTNAAAGDSTAGALTPAARATREFGPQPSSTPGSTSSAVTAGDRPTARVASSHATRPPGGRAVEPATGGGSAATSGEVEGGSAVEAGGHTSGGSSTGDSTAAEREFSPG
jgi:DNA-directed RNA polymerase specialized sigma24 family protein